MKFHTPRIPKCAFCRRILFIGLGGLSASAMILALSHSQTALWLWLLFLVPALLAACTTCDRPTA